MVPPSEWYVRRSEDAIVVVVGLGTVAGGGVPPRAGTVGCGAGGVGGAVVTVVVWVVGGATVVVAARVVDVDATGAGRVVDGPATFTLSASGPVSANAADPITMKAPSTTAARASRRRVRARCKRGRI